VRNPNGQVVLFSVIEAAGWATIAGIILAAATGPFTFAAVVRHTFSNVGAAVFAAGFVYGYVEHIIAYNAGKGRPSLEFPLKP
jgi:hypothetical protein